MLTKTYLKKELHFNDYLIELLLSEPIIMDNPRYRRAAPMQLWEDEDVERAMETDEYKQHIKEIEPYLRGAAKATQTKQENTMKMIESKIEEIKVNILDMSDDELRDMVVKNKQAYYNTLYNWYDKDAYGADAATIDRWVVNYIRHEETDYDFELFNLYGHVGKMSAYYKYRKAVLSKIAEAYPKYEEECQRQMENT